VPALDVAALLTPLSPESPSGQDLSYDAAYSELFRLAEGKPEQQMGNSVIPAEEPSWREVQSGCVAILKRSRDLRVVLLALVASVRSDGVSGLRDGIALLRGCIEQHWDTFFPRLDPADNNDPLERMNVVAALAAPLESFGDPLKVQRRIREAPLSRSRQLGSFGLAAIDRATNPGAPGDGKAGPQASEIDASFDDTPIEELQASLAAVQTAADDAKAFDAFLTKTVGAGRAPNLDSFHKCLSEVRAALDRALGRRGYGNGAAGAAAPGAAAAGAPSAPGEVRSTQDVLLAIDRICQYYERAEPSSPVPLLLKRARRLVSKSFLDIISDLSPDAMNQIKVISGAEQQTG
jgi:type VI secretion system protein ImpA